MGKTIFQKPISFISIPKVHDKISLLLEDIIFLLIDKQEDSYITSLSGIKGLLDMPIQKENIIRRLKDFDFIEELRVSGDRVIIKIKSEDVRNILLEPRVSLDFSIIRLLNRYGIIAYEYMKGIITGLLPSELTISDVRLLFCSNLLNHSNFKNFQTYVLKASFKELEQTDVKARYEFVLSGIGHKYEKIRFHAEDKNKPALPYIKVAAIPKPIPQEPVTYSLWKPNPYEILLMELRAQGLKGINGQRLIS